MARVATTSLLVVALAATAARAETGGSIAGAVTVVSRTGQPADPSEVVVYVVGFEEPPPRRAAEIRQRGKRFEPELVAITAGQEVAFPNDDPFFHNVFSPSPTRKFDLGQFPRGEQRAKRFPDVGIVEVFCNIHPEMAATVLILPNRRFARAAADGKFRLDGVPAGQWTLYAYSRRARAAASTPVGVSEGQTLTVNLTLEETRTDFAHPNKFGETYRDPGRYRP